MKETHIIMGMPVIISVAEATTGADIAKTFDYFRHVDQTFSTFKATSEISAINQGRLTIQDASPEVKEVFLLCDKTKQETGGYFDIVNNNGKLDPSGLVKGWAIWKAALMLHGFGYRNFYVEAGGDIQVFGQNGEGKAWTVGIKNPFNVQEIVKTAKLHNNEGIATSGSYERGAHIYNPKNRKQELAEIASITVIGKNIYEADRFATAAFAMQGRGIGFIESVPGLEGYSIDTHGIATMTSGFSTYV